MITESTIQQFYNICGAVHMANIELMILLALHVRNYIAKNVEVLIQMIA